MGRERPRSYARPTMRSTAGAAREDGQILPGLVVLLLAILALGVMGFQIGKAAILRSQAQTAADAAALAGAADGEAAARAVARANGAELVGARRDGAAFEAEVRLAGETATARAEGGGEAGRRGLVPELTAALRRAEALLGVPVPISSGYRSAAAQRALWTARAANPYPVARPGTSAHERGRAVDVPRSFAERLAAVGPRVGLCRPLPRTDPVHFEPCRPSAEGP
jgi:hypothetical protein